MLTASGPGDVACFVYSGHGGRFPADPANPGRYYEAIIPASGSPITDLDMYGLASQLDQSVVNFTIPNRDSRSWSWLSGGPGRSWPAWLPALVR